LQPAAITICPEIRDVLSELYAFKPTIARMTGSGATCFGLFERDMDCVAALRTIQMKHPDWWLMNGQLR
jgi:4-diphosphocytidyl-2-C-methyl-D-erythritol kinase